MPIEFDEQFLTMFFGVEPTRSDIDSTVNVIMYDYVGLKLKYSLWIVVDDEVVLVSGSTDDPFGAYSLYEISIPCDSINLIPVDLITVEGTTQKTGLDFYYGDSSQNSNLTLKLFKRPDGDLVVWPNTLWPLRHKNRGYQPVDIHEKRSIPTKNPESS